MFGSQKPLIGVIHLPPLPGYENSPGIAAIVEKALIDLRALESGPVDGVLVENENDKPHRIASASETTAAMTRVTRALVEAARSCRIGVEILLNDPEASLAVALAAGALFIRTDYFVDPMERPEHGGAMHIDPDGLLAYRRRIGAEKILILADIQVKYARMLEQRSLSGSAELAHRHGADAIVVTGTVTGEPPRIEEIEEAKSGASDVPVLIGSGVARSNARALLDAADGAIVGTSLKTGDHIDSAKVRELLDERRLCR
ncbi:MAG: BtpA/SgcQ family protein [Acidobacteriota bacterium]|nr:MAG: BtpA/SgcQ family protein [Acidobacteriota bacterium]